jgi:phage gp29-like protein
MDRAIAAICRGADLSTMSSGAHSGQGAGSAGGRGASVQGEESDILEQDDAAHMTETLEKLSRLVIAKMFGPEEQPLARLRIVVPQKKETADTINRLGFLLNAGVPVSMDYARKELGVPPPAPGEALLVTPKVPERPVPEPAAALANTAHTNAEGLSD